MPPVRVHEIADILFPGSTSGKNMIKIHDHIADKIFMERIISRHADPESLISVQPAYLLEKMLIKLFFVQGFGHVEGKRLSKKTLEVKDCKHIEFVLCRAENMFFFHLGMGLIDAKSDLCLTFGFPSDDDRDTYMGLDLEFVLNRTGPAISLTFGAHKQEWKGVDLRLLMSGKFDSFRPYMGFDSDYDFAEEDNQDDFWFMNLVLGFEVRFSHNAGFILEYAAEVAGSRDKDFDEADSSYISLGVVVYF